MHFETRIHCNYVATFPVIFLTNSIDTVGLATPEEVWGGAILILNRFIAAGQHEDVLECQRRGIHTSLVMGFIRIHARYRIKYYRF